MNKNEQNIFSDERSVSQSQNFLKDPNFVKRLIELTDIGDQDLIVEIGTGHGIITRQLAKLTGQVIGIEVDKKLADPLRYSFKDTSSVSIQAGDFRKSNLPKRPYKVFSNIPFNMTSDVVNKLTADTYLESAYLIVQREAAERFAAKSKGNTQVAMLLYPRFEVGTLTRIDRHQFAPAPEVDTSLLMIKKRKEPLVEKDEEFLYRDFLVHCFSQRERVLLPTLKKLFSFNQLRIISRNLDINKMRPSDLSGVQWLHLFNDFARYASQERKQLVVGAENNLKVKQGKIKKTYRRR